MPATRAVLVGIDNYPRYGKSVEGPCAGAIAMTRWLLSLDDADLRIDLFLADTGLHEESIAKLKALGSVKVHDADLTTLSNFLIEDLPKGCAPGTRLFVYWSSHGYTSLFDRRYFYCSDYSENQQNVFNASDYLRRLCTERYRCFDNQVVLSDVCGVHLGTFREAPEEHAPAPTRQLAYFATGRGEYAETGPEGGVFTLGVLKVLERLREHWSNHEALSAGISAAFAHAENRPFELYGQADRRAIHLAAGDDASRKPWLRAALAIVDQHDTGSLYRIHYRRTASQLGMPASAPTLRDAVHELGTMRDTGLVGGVTFGLLQLMMRLRSLPELEEAVDAWLGEYAARLTTTRTEIARLLARDDRQKVLLIEVLSTQRGEVTELKPHLCHADGAPVGDVSLEASPVGGWDDMVEKLQSLLRPFAPEGSFDNMAIHFAVDLPLFDRPFHRIPLEPGGDEIGSLTIVVTRHRQRMRGRNDTLHEKWNDYARALFALPAKEMRWQKFDTGPGAVSDETALFFAAFSLPDPQSGQAGNDQRKRDLKPLLQIGAPCLYLPHAEPQDADWDALGRDLDAWLAKITSLEKVAQHVYDKRVLRVPLALHATLFWDDPSCNPFFSIRGANDP